jgi:hypothetical protein
MVGFCSIVFTSDDKVIVCEVPVFELAGVAEGFVCVPVWFLFLVAFLFVVPCPLHIDRVKLAYF